MPVKTGDRLFGIVISPTDPGPIKNYVFYLIDRHEQGIFAVNENAFRLSMDEIEQKRQLNEFDMHSNVKNAQRRKELPLSVGDWISFTYDPNHMIDEFKRENQIYETRCTALGEQFKVNVVKSPTNDILFNDTFGFIKLDIETAHNIMADVAFDAWVTMHLNEDECDKKGFKAMTLSVSYDCFASTEYRNQIRVLETPWHEHHTIDMSDFNQSDDDDGEYLLEKNEVNGVKVKEENNITNKFGYYTSLGSLYVAEEPTKKFYIPVVENKRLMPGVCYRFDAFYSDLHKAHIVSCYSKMEDMPTMATKEEGDKILLLDTVAQRKEYPEIFSSEKHNLGVMDNPTGTLALHHLSRYAESKCRVYFYEDLNLTHGRFRIERAEEEKALKIEKNTEGKVIERGRGLVISNDRRVFCPKHPTLRFVLPINADVPPGQMITFTNAIHNHGNTFVIGAEEWKADEKEQLVGMQEMGGRLFFKTRLFYPDRGQRLSFVQSVYFCLLDDPLNILEKFGMMNSRNEMYAWVTESGFDKTGERRIAQTAFFIVKMSSSSCTEPLKKDMTFVDSNGRNVGGWLKDRNDITYECIEKVQKKPVGKTKKEGIAFDFRPKTRPSTSTVVEEDKVVVPPIPRPRRSLIPRKTCGCPLGRNDDCEARDLIIQLLNVGIDAIASTHVLGQLVAAIEE